MRRIAFLISSNMVAGAAGARDDLHELDLEFAALGAPCKSRLMPLEPVVWDDASVDWSRFDAVVVGTAWDYWDRPQEFLDRMDRFEADGARLFNPAKILRWNADKTYLRDLAEKGAPAIPTLWAEAATEAAFAEAFAAFETDTIVVKPRVGAAAHRLAKIVKGGAVPGPDHLPRAACLLQPYLSAIETRGEASLLFYDGVFSHAVRKIPKAGDFRVQSLYGAREEAYEPAPEEIAAATAALEAIGERLLYARVDVVSGLDGKPAVIELELIEPYHYPEQGPACGHHFAGALDRYLG